MDLSQKSILITGATGSLGKKLVELILKHHNPRRLVVFSRDEVKQLELRRKYPASDDSPMRYFIGNIRDRERLYRAFRGVDIVIHAAALKQVPTAEYNPLEVIKTNVIGAANIIDAAIDCNVEHVIALSTDKAVNPINLYGATKLCSDKLFIGAGVYANETQTRFSVVRYGNVIGSRGSVIPLFLKHKNSGVLPVTDERMTRFWITIEQAANFVIQSLTRMQGGEIFVPKLPSMKIVDVAKTVAPDCQIKVIGIRPGEKIHEVLVTEDEARRTIELNDAFVVLPTAETKTWDEQNLIKIEKVPENFRYSSDGTDWWLSSDELENMLEENTGPDAKVNVA